MVTGQDIRKNSICIIVSTSKFTARRTVSRAQVEVDPRRELGDPLPTTENGGIDQEMVTVAKDLLDSEELRAIGAHDGATKRWIKDHSAPSPLLRSSAYLISVDALADMYVYLEGRKKGREALEGAFEAAYPALVEAAKKRLGPLFDSTQYPSAARVGRLFGFDWQVVEMGTPDEKLRSVSQSLFEKEKDKAERAWTNAVGQINEALAAGMAEVVDHLSSKLGDGVEKPKRFHKSAIQRVTDFLDAFGQRNLTQNEDLTGLVEKARRLLSGVSVKDMRAKDAGARKDVAQGFAAIKASLDKMLEDRPSRAISLSDEEAV